MLRKNIDWKGETNSHGWGRQCPSLNNTTPRSDSMWGAPHPPNTWGAPHPEQHSTHASKAPTEHLPA